MTAVTRIIFIVRRWKDPTTLFILTAFVSFAALFYLTDFRQVLEHWFFDVRMRLAPQQSVVDDIVIVGIDDQTIDAMETSVDRLNHDAKQRPFLSFNSLEKILTRIVASNAQQIVVQLPNHAFSHSSFELFPIVRLVQSDRRITIGTTEYNRENPGLFLMPEPLSLIKDRVFGYETFRRRSNVFLRSVLLDSYRGLEAQPMLGKVVAERFLGILLSDLPSIELNHLYPENFQTISGVQLIQQSNDSEALLQKLDGRIVIVGYTTPRDIPFQTTEMMQVNTPLIGEEQNVYLGANIVHVLANTIENLIHQRYLRSPTIWLNINQSILIAAISGFFWIYSSVSVVVATCVTWLLLLGLHALALVHLSLHIPIADSFLASVLASIFAAAKRLRFDLSDLADRQAAAAGKREVARLQSVFLEDFSNRLRHFTGQVEEGLRFLRHHWLRLDSSVAKVQMEGSVYAPVDVEDVFQRSFAATEEFGDYLESIRQLPLLEASTRSLVRQEFDLRDLIQKILRRFSIKAAQKGVIVQMDISQPVIIYSNQSLMDSILFNIISNAIKYSPQDGVIAISYRSDGLGQHAVTVTDAGPGIQPELQERIFEKFYRIQDDRLFKVKGTGLGLYLAKYFAESLGGKISVKSTPPHGSQFTLVIR